MLLGIALLTACGSDEREPVESDQEVIRPIDELFHWPLGAAFLLVLGTMLGSVYERKKEIFVYNSVGLDQIVADVELGQLPSVRRQLVPGGADQPELVLEPGPDRFIIPHGVDTAL
mgnify:CR=1 FL=1